MKVIRFTKIYRCIAVAAFILLVLTGLFLMLSWMMLVPGNRVKSVSTYSGLYAETDVFVELVCGYEDIENGDVLVYEADVHDEKVLLAGRVQETTGKKIVLQAGISVTPETMKNMRNVFWASFINIILLAALKGPIEAMDTDRELKNKKSDN